MSTSALSPARGIRWTRAVLLSLLRFKVIRFWFVKTRHRWLRKRMTTFAQPSEGVGAQTVSHNLSAFDTDAVFGCGERMGLLIYPVVSYYSHHLAPKGSARVLVVGCRSEDDIFWLKSYGFGNTRGFDLLSYSKYVTLGDIHDSRFDNNTFDVVLLAWMISYSTRPDAVLEECTRILKPGGLLGIGLEHDPEQQSNGIAPPRVNHLNDLADVRRSLDAAARNQVVFEYDHYHPGDSSVAVVARILK